MLGQQLAYQMQLEGGSQLWPEWWMCQWASRGVHAGQGPGQVPALNSSEPWWGVGGRGRCPLSHSKDWRNIA
jgi:hypothetical protein